MPRTPGLRITVLLLIGCVLVANAVLFGGRVFSWVADFSGRMLAPVSARIADVRSTVGTWIGHRDLVTENRELTAELAAANAKLLDQDELQRQMQVLRDAAGIRALLGTDPVQAGIFSYPRAGGVRDMIINRGATQWIIVGDVVITARGELVGAVERVFSDHASVRAVGDPSLDVTVRISGTEVAGFVRSDGHGGLVMDLVQKDEQVIEGATVVTNGDDRFPAGLIVGTIRSVDNDAATLFKIVRVNPAVGEFVQGPVIVIRP